MSLQRSFIVIATMFGATASAQPGADDDRRRLVLTAEQQELLDDGEIGIGRHLGGGVTALVAGFGIGQGIEGRWRHTGWIFTFGESAAAIAIVYAVGERIGDCLPLNEPCRGDRGAGLMVGGLMAYSGLRIWEIVDAWIAPPIHNHQLHELRTRLAPFVAPARTGGIAGLAFQF
jgi:hypothetical protein